MLKKTIVLVGMMGSGKTAVGRCLSDMLGVPFLDSDQEIEKAANMTISEIFERDGEAFFRRAETRVLNRLLSGAPAVLSTGGGAFMQAKNRELISQLGISVWLNADLDVLWERVRHKDTRPLLQTADPRETLAQLLKQRVAFYEQADLQVKTQATYSIEDTASAVLNALDARPDVKG